MHNETRRKSSGSLVAVNVSQQRSEVGLRGERRINLEVCHLLLAESQDFLAATTVGQNEPRRGDGVEHLVHARWLLGLKARNPLILFEETLIGVRNMVKGCESKI